MSSFSFDPLAHIYDATRGYPPGVAEQIAQAIAHTANAQAQTRFLEVGVGTGRIAYPLADLGHIYTGVDISEKMVELLIEKLRGSGWQETREPWGSSPDEESTQPAQVLRYARPGSHAQMRLVMADMTSLPFHAASFDVAVAVHVFHLVHDWQKAISEIVRVIRPGGLFLHCWDEYIGPDRPSVGRAWEQIVRELGGKVRASNSITRNSVTAWLREQGYQPEEMRVTPWEIPVTPRQSLEHVTKRLWSSTLLVPDDLFAASIEPLERWAEATFGAEMDVAQSETHQFVISKVQL